jgi:hypothetical protein
MSVEKAGLESGTYTKDPEVTVTVWPIEWIENEDGSKTANPSNDIPNGFKRVNDYITRVDDKGEVLRDSDGNAGSIFPGEALVEYPDGSYLVINEDNVEWFLRSHKQSGGVQKSTVNKPDSKKAT